MHVRNEGTLLHSDGKATGRIDSRAESLKARHMQLVTSNIPFEPGDTVKATTRPDLVLREAIMGPLTDDEIAKVTTAEGAVRLAAGDEFLDLDGLARGVLRADGVLVKMGSVLPRRAVHQRTWGMIVALLPPPPNVPKAAHA